MMVVFQYLPVMQEYIYIYILCTLICLVAHREGGALDV
jgi:hypothetical protein